VGFRAKCVRDAFLFSTATRPAPGGYLGLLEAVHLELRISMRKLTTHCRLSARLCPALRPPLMRCHAVTHKQKDGKLFSCLVAFQFPIHILAIYLPAILNSRLRGLHSFQLCITFLNNKFSGLQCCYVFCVETKNNGDFKNTNFRVFTQEFFFKIAVS